MSTNWSIRSSFLKSPLHPTVSGPVLGTPDYLSKYLSFCFYLFDIVICIAQVRKFYCKMKFIVCPYFIVLFSKFIFYLAPAVDFWSLGICLYQFLVGVTPFSDDCPRAVISNILDYRLIWPEDDDDQLSDDAISVIKGLLNYDSTLRFQLDGR
jgi:serine/threonine protein kinase